MFEAQQSFHFMQHAAAQGLPRAAVCVALATLFAAESDLDKRDAFASILHQAVLGYPAAQHCVGELQCSGCGCARRCESAATRAV